MTIRTTVILTAVALFSTQCRWKKTTDNNTCKNGDNLHQLKVAYVDSDSLFAHFSYYTNLLSSFEKKINERNIFLNSSYQKLQNEITNFQQKIQNNAFPTQEKMKQEQIRIQNLEENLKKKTTQIEKIWILKQKQLEKSLSDSILLGINEFNTPQKYQLIFMKTGGTILYGDKQYNITNEVINFLNKRFPSVIVK
jgi:outer membrane protein